MKASVLLVFCLLAAVALSKHGFDYSKKRSIMNVMLEVETKLKTKAPIDAILNILRDFRDAVNVEQVNHDEIYTSQQAECESENHFRNI